MKNSPEQTSHRSRKLFLATIMALAALTVPLVVGALIAPRLLAQAPAGQASAATAERPAFEVASIKPNKSGDNRVLMGGPQTGGRFTATNVTLNNLITAAYQLKPQQISGLPDWASSEHFDIEAKAEGNPPREQINLMLQSLLADRFKLVTRREPRRLQVYALVVSKPGKTGPQLTPHSDDSKCIDAKVRPGPPPGPGQPLPAFCGGFFASGSPRGMRLAGQKVTIEMVAQLLSRQLDRVVIDKTGLTGTFEVNLEFALQQPFPGVPPADSSDPSAPPSIFTAVQEQLGLKLEAQTGSVEIMVVDHAERPSEN